MLIFLCMGIVALLDYSSAQSAGFSNLVSTSENTFPKISQSIQDPQNCHVADSAQKLSLCLTESLTSELEKTFAIYFWIARNISYDVEGVKACTKSGRGCPNQSSESVLKRKTAICDGYARLFHEMTYYAGLKSRKVNGYADSRRKPEALGFPNHAWNLIKINEVWYPLDVTWDAGFVDEKTNIFSRNVGAFQYFLSDPTSFGKEHLSADPKWQVNMSSRQTKILAIFDDFISNSPAGKNQNSISEHILFVWHKLTDNPPMPYFFITLFVIAEHFFTPDVFYFPFFGMCFWMILATVPVWLVEKLISVCLFISAPFRFLYRKLSE